MIWELSRVDGPCGACREPIPIGTPLLRVTEHRLVRCVACAKRGFHAEPPDNLEPISVSAVERLPQPAVFVTPKQFAQDWKRAQSGER